MQIGNLKDRITFQRKSFSGKASTGQDLYTWADFSPTIVRSASIKPIKGDEIVEARGTRVRVQHSIMVRYDPEVATVSEQDRIIEHEDSPVTVYSIHAIMKRRGVYEVGDKWLEFWCTQGLQDLN